jgi:exopolysaccharide production protein ExoQ
MSVRPAPSASLAAWPDAVRAPPAPDRTALAALWLASILIIHSVLPEGLDYSLASMPTEGSLTSRAIWIGLLGGSLLLLAWRNALTLTLLRVTNPFLLLLVLWSVASVAWSIDPGVTIRRLIRLAAIVACALAVVVAGWHAGRFQRLVRPALTLLIAGSLGFGLLAPQLGIMQSLQPELAGAWRGLATHKNSLGSIASLGFILWFHALLTRDARVSVALPAALLAAVCLYLSRSSTSWLATATAVFALLLLLGAPAGMRRALPVLTVLLVLLMLGYTAIILQVVPGLRSLLEPIAALTGKDLSFTGRTELWELMRQQIAAHPNLGAGFGAFWIGEVPTSPSYSFLAALWFYPGQAHNGYLDVVNELGLLGGALLLAWLASYLAQGLRLLPLDRRQAALYLALIFQQLTSNLSESRWWNVLSVEFIVLTIATVALARDLLEARLRAAQVAAGAVRTD